MNVPLVQTRAAPQSSTRNELDTPVPTRERAVRLNLSGIERQYGALAAVRGLDLSVLDGELVALLGPSGCGKTTTLRLIAGFEAPDAGVIEIAGQRVADDRRFTPPERRRVGMVFQDYALFPHLSVGQNVGFGIAREPDRRERVTDALAQVGLDGLAERMPHQLSGGQQQRVALARALAPRPDLVLLDEPFSNLDPHLRSQLREEVREILRRARGDGRAGHPRIRRSAQSSPTGGPLISPGQISQNGPAPKRFPPGRVDPAGRRG